MVSVYRSSVSSKRSAFATNLSFFRIPKVVHSRGFKNEQVSRKRFEQDGNDTQNHSSNEYYATSPCKVACKSVQLVA